MFSVEGPTIIVEFDDVHVEPMSTNEGSITVVVVARSLARPIMLSSSSQVVYFGGGDDSLQVVTDLQGVGG